MAKIEIMLRKKIETEELLNCIKEMLDDCLLSAEYRLTVESVYGAIEYLLSENKRMQEVIETQAGLLKKYEHKNKNEKETHECFGKFYNGYKKCYNLNCSCRAECIKNTEEVTKPDCYGIDKACFDTCKNLECIYREECKVDSENE